MDLFDLSLPEDPKDPHSPLSLTKGLKRIKCPALIIGVKTDILFPCWQQSEIANKMKEAGNNHVKYYELDADYGHDTFLIEIQAVGSAIKGHLEHHEHSFS